jgi:predicted NAD/FAD-dependent oxidoreductase
MTLNSLYSLTICLPAAVDSVLSQAMPKPFVCRFVHNHKSLRFICNQSKKFDKQHKQQQQYQVWTILSSATFAKKHKAPQEFLPGETIETVSTLLLQAVEESLGLADKNLQSAVVERWLQLWGAALPLNVWGKNMTETSAEQQPELMGLLHDGKFAVGACGDWLLEPSVAGAWTSGKLLADYMIHRHEQYPKRKNSKAGLNGAFYLSESASQVGIGAIVV